MINIIGAGPSGLFTGYNLAKKGFDVKVFDQKKEIGLPIQCTGIVTSKIKDILNIRDSIIENKIRNIEVNSENNSTSIRLNKPDLILNRERFDQYLADMTEAKGVKVCLRKKFIGKERKEVMIKDLNSGKIDKKESDILIGADGPLSRVYNIVNPDNKRTLYKGIQVRAKGNFDKSTFKVYLGDICPNFFAWLVPENESVARIGLASLENPKPLLKKFLEKLNMKKAIEMQAGLIPMYDPRIKTQKNSIYLVGDAAGQIKSTTGGGIVQGLTAAKILADSIAKNKDYESEWRNSLSKDLWVHLKIRHYLNKFKDNDYDSLVDMIKNEKTKEILENESRDTPSKMMIKLIMSNPGMLRFASKLF